MASWRVKGYVSDSEDEDGGVDINDRITIEQALTTPTDVSTTGCDLERAVIEDVQTPQGIRGLNGLIEHGETSQSSPKSSSSESPKPLSTACRLQESLQKASELVSSVQQSSTILNKQDGIQNSSPLSSPANSPRPPSSIGRIRAGQEDFPLVEQPFLVPAAAQRTFRQRTANQLQPYTIDRAKHIQEWSALGIKPVALPRSRSPVPGASKSATEDSQFEESQSQVGDSISQDAMDSDVPLQSSQPTERGMYNVTFEDDLPDLASLLERRSPRSMKKSRRITILSDVPSSDSDHLSSITRRKNTMQKTQLDSLPSPPLSLHDDLLRPIQLVGEQESSPQPEPSSTARPRKRPVIEDDTQSTNGDRVSDQVQVIHIQDDTSSDESVLEKEAEQIMQKRIKGVLPASWWTVEMAQQSLAAKKKQISRQHARRVPHAGVAQRKVSSHDQPRQTRDDDFEELLSDDASENEARRDRADPIYVNAHTGLYDRRSNSSPLDGIDDMDIVEENEIDFMLAPQRRKRSLHGRSKSQSTAVATSRTNFETRKQHQHSVDGLPQHRHTKRVKSKSTAGKVHVLDAPDLRSPKQNTPSFLKVAARRARSKPRSGGTHVSRKFFHLDSDDDDDHSAHDIDSNFAPGSHRRRNLVPSIPKRQLPEKARKTSTGLHTAFSGTTKSAIDRANRGNDAEKRNDQNLPPDAAKINGKTAAPGYLVQCGQADDATLRLTHLRSLLPLTNRSGHGRFITHHQQPREAQLETLEPVSGLSTRPRRRIISAAQKASVTRQDSNHIVDNNDPQPRPSNQAVKHRRRKQVPVQRQNLRQKSLVAPDPDTKDLANLVGRTDPTVRDILEQEFNTHQAAWFQASRQDIIYSNQVTQQHFYTFLDVLKSYLPMALQDAEDEREARELRSFIHRLIPNRGQIGASGQVGNKSRSVQHYDILIAQNVFELHKCLLSLAPGAAPRPRVLEMKVNFADAHEEICLLALATWRDICQAHINDLEIIHGMGSWLYSMLHQLADRWVAAETDAQREIASLTHLTGSDAVHYAVEHNQKRVCALFCKVLAYFTECVQEATSVTEAQSLFRINDFVQALNHLNSIDKLNSNVAEALFMAAAAYVGLSWMPVQRSEVLQLVEATHKSFVVVTGSQHLTYAITHSLTKSFFFIAKAAIDQGQITWDHLLTPAAHLSLERLDPRQPNSEKQKVRGQNLTIIKSIFYHYLVEKVTLHYQLELRPTIISFWILMLLEADEQDQHWRPLTRSLFQYEAASMRMPLLASKFCGPGSIDDAAIQDISISELRHAVILHVIAVLHEQEKDVEADEVPGGFESEDARVLSKGLFTEMREHWQSLRTDPDQQELYTLLIHAALRQIELYPRQDIVVDSWFYNSATFPQPVRNDLFQILNGSSLHEDTTMNKAAELFSLEFEQASRFDRIEILETKLQAALIRSPWATNTESTASMLVEHGRFFRLTIEACLKNFSVNSQAAIEVLVRLLAHLMDDLHCCAEADDPSSLKRFMQSISPILSILRALLNKASASFKINIFTLTRLIYSWTVATFHDISDTITGDMEAICEIASEDGSPQSLLLLEAVVTMG